MGRVLKSWKNVGPSLEDELNLVPGIYFLSVVGNGSLEVFKEVIQCEI
jgi:hypothetical protein